MSWLPIGFVILVILMMIVLGYYLTRSFLREYTYDVPSKTQSICALFLTPNTSHFVQRRSPYSSFLVKSSFLRVLHKQVG